ncbi:hypothetical protein NUSPORA_00186 [Nucleospora cyclopteri]
MLKISVVPDTNVFISHLEFVNRLINANLPAYLTINVSKAVIEELDLFKKDQENASKAVKMILQNDSDRIELQGYKDERRVEVEVTSKGEVPVKNNDDRILNYAMELENPVILTNDQLFIVKCKTKNVRAISVESNDEITVLNGILNIVGINVKEVDDGVYDKLEVLRCKLLPIIKEILFKELGQTYVLLIEKEDLLFLLKLILDNFFLFKNYLPKTSRSLLNKFKKAVSMNNTENINKELPLIYSLFRIK